MVWLGVFNIFGELQIRYPIVIGLMLGLFTLATLKTAKKGGLADFLPIVAIDTSIVAFGCAFAYSNLLRAMLFPAILLVYGLIAVFLRYKWGSENGEKTSLEYVIPVVLGVLLAFVFKKFGRAPMAYWITALSVFGAGVITAAVLTIVKRGTKFAKQCSAVAFCGTAFCIIVALLVPSALVSGLFLISAGVTGLAPVLAKHLK